MSTHPTTTQPHVDRKAFNDKLNNFITNPKSFNSIFQAKALSYKQQRELHSCLTSLFTACLINKATSKPIYIVKPVPFGGRLCYLVKSNPQSNSQNQPTTAKSLTNAYLLLSFLTPYFTNQQPLNPHEISCTFDPCAESWLLTTNIPA